MNPPGCGGDREGRSGETEVVEAYGDFWAEIGARFPDLGGAASTRLYRECEKRLLAEHLPAVEGIRLFKTDLWDEARNTRILAWARSRGTRVFGVDVSLPTLVLARRSLGPPAGLALGDVRAIPFAGASFDAVYSMGTIEHFDETEQAVSEIFRVLRPGGTAIVGVPNRHDPFLRPLMVRILGALGLYAYGFEKSYSRRQLREMLAGAGFEVRAETGILFIPGGLRMLDLLLHTRFPPLDRPLRPLVALFAWLERRVPRLRRHGYLIAAVAVRPSADPAAGLTPRRRPRNGS